MIKKKMIGHQYRGVVPGVRGFAPQMITIRFPPAKMRGRSYGTVTTGWVKAPSWI